MEKIIELYGHDGSEILWPELSEPLKRRGFHWQETIQVCLSQNIPCWVLFNQLHVQSCDQADPKFYDVALSRILDESNAVIAGTLPSGQRHAIAKVRELYCDPSTGTKSLHCPVTPELILVIQC